MEKIDYKKSLGQNFIFDKNLLNAIASDGQVKKNDVVLELKGLIKLKKTIII